MNKGLDMVSIKIRWNNIRIVAGMAMLSLFLLAGSASAEPPPAILKIDGNEQISGIGTNCWKVENETFRLCADYAGIITPAEPLLTKSPFTAILRLPLQVPPEELEFSTFRVTDENELNKVKGAAYVAWNFEPKNWSSYNVPLERESDINLSLEPGLYVLNVFVKWKEKGDVSYGFLVQVYEPEAKITNKVSSPEVKITDKVSSGEKTAGFDVFLAITAFLLVITLRRNRRK